MVWGGNLEGLPAAVLVPVSESVARGLRLRESAGSSLSAEQSLKTEALTISPSKSAGVGPQRMHEGFGSGRNNDGLEGFSSLDFADILISESTRPKLEGCKPGSGRGWAWGLSAKLWHLATLEGEGDLDSDGERSPFSEIVSLLRLRDPPDIVLRLPSDGNLNFLCNVSIILSLPAFFLVSFDDDFPHHVGIFVLDKLRSHEQVSWKDSDNNSSKNLSFHISKRNS